MLTKINRVLAESIKTCLAQKIAENQPRLNFEITEYDRAKINILLGACIDKWEVSHIICMKVERNSLSAEIINKESVSDLLNDKLEFSVMSIINPLTMNGITFDAGDSFMVTGWGKCESVPEEFGRKFPRGVLFRGN